MACITDARTGESTEKPMQLKYADHSYQKPETSHRILFQNLRFQNYIPQMICLRPKNIW